MRLNKAPDLSLFLQNTCCMQVILIQQVFDFFLRVLFNIRIVPSFLPSMFKHSNNSHMQKQEWVYV